MTKTTGKKRILSVLLTLCLAVALFAGLSQAAPLQASAETTGWTRAYVKVEDHAVQGEPMTVGFYFNCNSTAVPETLYFWLLQGGNAVPLGSYTGTFTQDGVYYFTFTAPAAGVYDGYMYSKTPYYSNGIAELTITISPPSIDFDYERHHQFWCSVLTQLDAVDNNGTVEVDTSGHGLAYILSCVFGKLENTNRTLIIHHQNLTYTIRGGPDVDGYMGIIRLGHNHLFSSLGAYCTA